MEDSPFFEEAELKPLKALFVFGHRRKLGAVRMLVPLERALKKQGVELFFAVEQKEDFSGYPDLASKVFEVKGLTDWRSLRGKLMMPQIVLKLRRILKKQKTDIIYVHHLSAFPYSWVTSKLSKIPHVVAVRNIYSKKDQFRKLMLNRATNIMAVSNAVLSVVNDCVENKSGTRRFVVYNGIDIESFLSTAGKPLPPGLRPPEENMIIGMVSAMDRNKNPQFLLKVARKVIDVHPKVTFLFAGRFPDPEYETETKKLAGSLGLDDHVIFAGQQADISSFFAAFDILAHPSPKRPEPFGLVLIEAMAHGKPVVASRIGGIPEIVLHNETGILCKPGDQQEFADAILKLALNPDLRSQFGLRGYERVREKFTIEKTAEGLAGFLRQIAKGGKPFCDEASREGEVFPKDDK